MKLIQSNIKSEDKELAISVRNSIINGNYVIGNPSLALKQSLKKLEEERDKPLKSETDWKLRDTQLETSIALTKAGIEGELALSEYLAKLLKLEKELFGIVAFASLSYGETFKKDYIPDTDMILVYGKNVLIIDSKKLKTKANEKLFMLDNAILNEKGKELISFNPSIHFWQNIFNKAKIEVESIFGLVCIVNDTNVEIVKDEEWLTSPTKLVHISELKGILKSWVQKKETDKIYLDILTEVAKGQVKEERENTIDFSSFRKQFGV